MIVNYEEINMTSELEEQMMHTHMMGEHDNGFLNLYNMHDGLSICGNTVFLTKEEAVKYGNLVTESGEAKYMGYAQVSSTPY